MRDPTKHYPNKDEAQMLRKIMSTTGLTEEEVRTDVKYRKMLSSAQKMGQKAKRSREDKFYSDLIKQACKQTKLAKEHPETIKVLQEIIDDRFKYGFVFFPRGVYSWKKPIAKQLIKQY